VSKVQPSVNTLKKTPPKQRAVDEDGKEHLALDELDCV